MYTNIFSVAFKSFMYIFDIKSDKSQCGRKFMMVLFTFPWALVGSKKILVLVGVSALCCIFMSFLVTLGEHVLIWSLSETRSDKTLCCCCSCGSPVVGSRKQANSRLRLSPFNVIVLLDWALLRTKVIDLAAAIYENLWRILSSSSFLFQVATSFHDFRN